MFPYKKERDNTYLNTLYLVVFSHQNKILLKSEKFFNKLNKILSQNFI